MCTLEDFSIGRFLTACNIKSVLWNYSVVVVSLVGPVSLVRLGNLFSLASLVGFVSLVTLAIARGIFNYSLVLSVLLIVISS